MEHGLMNLRLGLLWLLLTVASAEDLPLCKESDYHFEYTACDVLGSRWRVAVPNKEHTCTGLPDPVKGTQCTFSCSEGEFLNMQTQECQKCAVGTYSLGTGVAFDEWDSLPAGFITHGVMTNDWDSQTDCSNSTWTPKGDFIVSNTDECSVVLSYAVNLKQAGTVSFEYFYEDNSIYFEFFIQNDQCQSTESESRWMKISDQQGWSKYEVELNKGTNVLYWRSTSYMLGGGVKPVKLRNIAISGVAYTSECFYCKPGYHSASPGAARCAICPADTYSTKGATVCHQCEPDKYAAAGSGSCEPRPLCTSSDYFYTHTPCDADGQTQLMYKWNDPKICNETLEGSVTLPASGEKQSCPPCNPGFFTSTSSTCEPCPSGLYSNGTACEECPVGTEPVFNFEYKWWNTMPDNMKTFVFTEDLIDSDQSTAWAVAGDYIYTTPGDRDTDILMLTLSVPGYRSLETAAKSGERNKLSRITFVYDTVCTADCKLFFSAGYNQWNNELVEQWNGSQSRQSYSHLIHSNSSVSFTWSFQRTSTYTTERVYSSDVARIYSVHITNVIGGVASECHRCALSSNVDNSACVPCPPGHFMASGTGECQSCPSNSYIRSDQLVGKDACVQCGPNTKSDVAFSSCLNDCTLDIQSREAELLHYDFSSLANVTGFNTVTLFTSRGVKYSKRFNVALCGKEVTQLCDPVKFLCGDPELITFLLQDRTPATCVNNVTGSTKKVKGYICQSTIVPSGSRSENVVSSQPFVIGDSLIGVTTDTTLSGISSPEGLFPSESSLPDVIFYYKSSDTTQACKQGRAAAVRLRCDPTVSVKDHFTLPSNCSEGTCDGCVFHLLWRSQHACPLCTKSHYKEIISACIQGIQKTTYVWQQPLQCYGGETLPAQKVSACVSLDFWLRFGVMAGVLAAVILISISCYFWKRTRKLEYKYSRLMVNSEGKESELPAADSCAIMEGDDAEEDLMDLTRKSFFKRMKTFPRERTSDGFDSVPLKSSSSHFRRDDSDSDD